MKMTHRIIALMLAAVLFAGLALGAVAMPAEERETDSVFEAVGSKQLNPVLRNNFDTRIGTAFTVGTKDIYVTELGRLFWNGNAQTHAMAIVDATTGQDVANTAVTVPATGSHGKYTWAALKNPVKLEAGKSYYIVSAETNGGDTWLEAGSTFVGSEGVTLTGSAFWLTDHFEYAPGTFFNGTSLKYTYEVETVTEPSAEKSWLDGWFVHNGVRNNFGSYIGITVKVGASDIHVTKLGRMFYEGNTQSHVLKLVDAETLQEVAQTTVNMEGGQANSFRYGTLASPVTLTANKTYYFLSQEHYEGDAFAEHGFRYDATAGLTATGAAFYLPDNNSYNPDYNGPYGYVGLNLKYTSDEEKMVPVGTAMNAVGSKQLAYILRNNFDTRIGTALTVGEKDIYVTELGRLFWNGNTQTHAMAIVDAATGLEVANTAVTVPAAGSHGEYTWASLAAPVKLEAGKSYYIVSSETNGGDMWLEAGSTFTGSEGVTLTGSAFWLTDHFEYAPGTYFNGTNLKYSYEAPESGEEPSAAKNWLDGWFVHNGVRNTFHSYIGVAITVGAQDISITEIGRMFYEGNVQQHTLKLVDAQTLQTVAQTTVDMAGGQADTFTYGKLAEPVTLTANKAYYLLSEEHFEGDTFAEHGFRYDAAAGATATGGVFYLPDNDTYNPDTAGNYGYVGLDFKYTAVETTDPEPTDPEPANQKNWLDGWFVHNGVRNDFGSFIGVVIQTGEQAVTLTQLGRMFYEGNSQEHILKIVDAQSRQTVAQTTVNMAGGQADTFTYGKLAEPVSLNPNTTYYFLSQEHFEGDAFAHHGFRYDATAAATATGAVFYLPDNDSYNPDTAGNYGFVGLDFKYIQEETVTPSEPGEGEKWLADWVVHNGLRNTFHSYIGVVVQVRDKDINVTSLGRMFYAGNAQEHTLKIVDAQTLQTAAEVTVNMTGGTENAFTYGKLSEPVTLTANKTYYLLSEEHAEGDLFAEHGFQYNAAAGATATGGVFYLPEADTYNPDEAGNYGFVGLDFTYTVVEKPVEPELPEKEQTDELTWLKGWKIHNGVRNDFGSYIGITVKVGSHDLYLTQLGRMFYKGNTQEHILKLVDADTLQEVCQVTVNMDGGKENKFTYGQLAYPVKLEANKTYYFLSQEHYEGDAFAHHGFYYDSTSAAKATGAAYYLPGDHSYYPDYNGPYGYVGLDFKYTMNKDEYVPESTGNSGSVSNEPEIGGTYTKPTKEQTEERPWLDGWTVHNGLRNNFGSYVGVEIMVGNQDLYLTELGRMFYAGNKQKHILKIVDAQTKEELCRVAVKMTGGEEDAFVYAQLEGPVKLTANRAYYLLSQEYMDGDKWAEHGFQYDGTTGARAIGSVYYLPNERAYYTDGNGKYGFVGLDFKYTMDVEAPAEEEPAKPEEPAQDLQTQEPDAPVDFAEPQEPVQTGGSIVKTVILIAAIAAILILVILIILLLLKKKKEN